MILQLTRKYANLPDLDSAPDIYETPELTDDNSTTVGRARSESTASSFKDLEYIETETSGISRSRIHPNEARLHFASAVIDAQNVDFSDRVTAKRKSYKASSRHQNEYGRNILGYGDFSDEEESERVEKKLARLKREIEEIRIYIQGQTENENAVKKETEDIDSDLTSINKVLSEISIQKIAGNQSMSGVISRKIGTGIKAAEPSMPTQGFNESATYTVTYAPSYQQSHALAKSADFDRRLAILEKNLGIMPTELSSLTLVEPQKAILPTLDKIQRQLSMLSQTTPSTLNSMSHQIHNLVQKVEKLEDARKVAMIAQSALEKPERELSSEPGENLELVAKINDLYKTLPTVEKLSPILPPLLDRLRSLRAIHADAAATMSSLDQIDKEQFEVAEQIKKWREGLSKLENSMTEAQSTMDSNMRVMEESVNALEEKIVSLGKP